jgi:hypothetical protein
LIEKRNVAGNLKRIEQTAKAQLEELMNLGDRFNDAYDRYLQVLAPAVQKHLILATYQICTRGYPEPFLALSLDERVSVQSQLQQLAQQIRLGFEAYFESEDLEERESEPGECEPEEDNDRAGIRSSNLADISTWRIEDLTSAKLKQFIQDQHKAGSDDPNRPSSPDAETPRSGDPSDTPDDADAAAANSPSPDRLNLTEQEAHMIALALKAKLQAKVNDDEDEDEDNDDDVTTPDSLRSWQRSVERDIARMLHQASIQANQLLHQYGILPQEFPLGLLEALGQGDAIAEIPTGTPNLLKLTIKSGSPDANESHSGTLHLMAIHLHLAEIEFSETAVSQVRHTIRQLLAELSGLRKRYAANQKEYTIAKAEAAWRSTWSRE